MDEVMKDFFKTLNLPGYFKPTGSSSKDSSWKILKKKIRSGIFKKSMHGEFIKD
jgi:hypothetical protein